MFTFKAVKAKSSAGVVEHQLGKLWLNQEQSQFAREQISQPWLYQSFTELLFSLLIQWGGKKVIAGIASEGGLWNPINIFTVPQYRVAAFSLRPHF